MTDSPIAVLVADDHPVVRRGVAQLLVDSLPVCKVGEAASANEVLSLARDVPWDIVILDLNLGGRSGLDVIQQLKVDRPKLPVLVLSMYSEEQYAIRALRAGASGYVTKEGAPELLVTAVRRVVAGGRYISQSVADRLAAELVVNTTRPVHEVLSDREFEVFQLIGQGKSTRDIAEQLHLSSKTVDVHRSHIKEKLALKDATALIRHAVRWVETQKTDS